MKMVDLNVIFEALSVTQHAPLSASGFNAPAGESEDLNEFAPAFDAAVRWLATLKRPKSTRHWRGSYALKHECERSTRIYTPNGIMIAAAFAVGIPVLIVGDGPNALIGVSTS